MRGLKNVYLRGVPPNSTVFKNSFAPLAYLSNLRTLAELLLDSSLVPMKDNISDLVAWATRLGNEDCLILCLLILF
jgi:hypothetical protein